jgi:AraC-like DNA-binding protein
VDLAQNCNLFSDFHIPANANNRTVMRNFNRFVVIRGSHEDHTANGFFNLNIGTIGYLHEITELSFFGYDTNEALHVSESEKVTLRECLKNIGKEISLNIDRHTHDLILANLNLLFSYCTRFYDRQFLTRKKVSNDVVQKFEKISNDYFAQESLVDSGLPDVTYFASRLNLSANYLTDLLTKYTGKSTHEHVHLKVIDKAKMLLWSTDRSVSEIAYDLGFEHPSHFTKLFKARTGQSPRAFRIAS